MIYFTADLHFGHNKEFIYKKRGFNSVDEMNNKIIENWNNIIKDNDEIYIIGDLMLCDNKTGIELYNQLKGKKYIIWGNHDTSERVKLYKQQPNTTYLGYSTCIKYNKLKFLLSHYPTFTNSCVNITNELNNKILINLYGHTHQNNNFYEDNPYMYHIGLDSHNCQPVSIDNIIKDISNKIKTKE